MIKFTSGPGSESRSLPSLTFVLDRFEELNERVPIP
jgi:hypothetical protein